LRVHGRQPLVFPARAFAAAREVGTRLCVMPTWTLTDQEMHPWQPTVRGDWPGQFARVTADRLDVTENGTLVFIKDDHVCLVIQAGSYGCVRLMDWVGLTPTDVAPVFG
jgi:hypothetical protein